MYRCAVLFCVFLCHVWMIAGQGCSTPGSESFKFDVNIFRNRSEYLVGQVAQDRRARNVAGMWNVDVDNIVAECSGNRLVYAAATFTGTFQTCRKFNPGYKLVPGLGYYKLHTTHMTWNAAREVCAIEGGHLLILNSDEEWKAVKEIWLNSIVSKINGMLVGISDFAREGQYVTLFGDLIDNTGYTKWHPQHPNHGGNCIEIDLNGLLFDEPCTDTYPFICEML